MFEVLGSDGLSPDESVELDEFADYLEKLRMRMARLSSKFKGKRLSGKLGKGVAGELAEDFLTDEDLAIFGKYSQDNAGQSQNSSRSPSPPPEL